MALRKTAMMLMRMTALQGVSALSPGSRRCTQPFNRLHGPALEEKPLQERSSSNFPLTRCYTGIVHSLKAHCLAVPLVTIAPYRFERCDASLG
jgi:hypothetical protein